MGRIITNYYCVSLRVGGREAHNRMKTGHQCVAISPLPLVAKAPCYLIRVEYSSTPGPVQLTVGLLQLPPSLTTKVKI